MPLKILTICGSGVGTSEILRVTVRRALARLGVEADVVATDVDHVAVVGEDAQVILATADHVARLPRTYAQVIVVDNILDQAELETKLAAAVD